MASIKTRSDSTRKFINDIGVQFRSIFKRTRSGQRDRRVIKISGPMNVIHVASSQDVDINDFSREYRHQLLLAHHPGSSYQRLTTSGMYDSLETLTDNGSIHIEQGTPIKSMRGRIFDVRRASRSDGRTTPAKQSDERRREDDSQPPIEPAE